MATIPANAIVQVTPAVLSAGGQGLDLIGLFLTTSTRVPIGAAQPFSSADDVGDYFGSGSTEKTMADVYFGGFENSHIKPGRLLIAQFNTAAVAAWMRGGALGLTLAQLNALATGTFAVTSSGVLKTSATIDLSAAASFSAAAALIQAAFTTPGFTVAYDSTADAFVFTSTTTGATSTITVATTTALATSLKLTTATGAVTSQGAAIAVPGTFMDGVKAVTQNWATFTTLFNPDVSGNANKLLFAIWTNSQNKRYKYECWDTDSSPTTTVPATSSLGYLLEAGQYSGTSVIYAPDATLAAFACGVAASIDFTQHEGRTNTAFRRQSGLTPSVTSRTVMDNLIANGYNFYGAYATANDDFNFYYPGSVSGDFLWSDSFLDQIWMNNAFQLALMTLLVNALSIPYNAAGRVLIEQGCMDVITAAVNFGAVREGVALSAAQAALVNQAAGVKIDTTLATRGWYLQVLAASAITRAARESPPCSFWYMDGQSVQKIDLASIELQ